MAHKKGAASTKNGRDSNPQYLGVKRFGGELVAEDPQVDRLVAGQLPGVEGREALERGSGEGEARGSAGIGQVRPFAVVLVVAELGGVDRGEAEVLGEQLVHEH